MMINFGGFLFNKYPMLVSISIYVGLLRMMIKPLTSLIEIYVEWSPSKKDDSSWQRFKSKTMPFIIKGLDLLTSIKKPSVMK